MFIVREYTDKFGVSDIPRACKIAGIKNNKAARNFIIIASSVDRGLLPEIAKRLPLK